MIHNIHLAERQSPTHIITYLMGRAMGIILLFLFGSQGVMGQDLIITPGDLSVTDPLPANFTVTVDVENNDQKISAFRISLSFDPEKLQALGTSPLSGYTDLSSPTINNADGTIVYNISSGAPPSGDYSVASVSFQAIAPGETDVAFVVDGEFKTLVGTVNGNALESTTGATINIVEANALPVVEITSPVESSSFTTGDDVPIVATASDTDGTISSVEFFDGTTSIGTDAEAPYAVTLPSISEGDHIITATATDDAGGQTTSEAVTITAVSQAADIVLVPSATTITGIGETFTVSVQIQAVGNQEVNAAETTFSYDPNVIQVNGTNGITVNKTTFDQLAVTPQAPSDASSNTLAYAGGSANNATGSFEVFSIEFVTVGVGTTDFTFFAENSVLLTEQELLRNLSAPTITVSTNNTLPTVTITSPEESTTFMTGNDVPIVATATDDDGTISFVEFFDGTTSLGVDTEAPYAVTLPSISEGDHVLTAISNRRCRWANYVWGGHHHGSLTGGRHRAGTFCHYYNRYRGNLYRKCTNPGSG